MDMAGFNPFQLLFCLLKLKKIYGNMKFSATALMFVLNIILSLTLE